MIISKKAWHFKLYNWFVEGKLPPIINLCSYVRAVLFWAPLKAMFYNPGVKLHQKSKVLFYVILFILIGVIEAVLVWQVDWLAALWLICMIFWLVYFIKTIQKTIVSDWKGAKDARPVQYTEKTWRVLRAALKYVLGVPLKTLFWTIWIKMYDFNKAFFEIALAIAVISAVGAIFYGLYLIDFWWQALAIIGGSVFVMFLLAVITGLLEGRKVSIKNSIIWQFLKAKKEKICPIIKLEDEE